MGKFLAQTIENNLKYGATYIHIRTLNECCRVQLLY